MIITYIMNFNLGGGLNGIAPKQTITNYKDSEATMSRRVLRDGWNTANASGVVNGRKRIITPFRAVNNLGDFLSRQNYVCGGPNQVNADRPGWKSRIGSIISQCDGSGVAAGSGNMRFVSDSSDYTNFRKKQAINQNYNDIGFGGYNNAAYVATKHASRGIVAI